MTHGAQQDRDDEPQRGDRERVAQMGVHLERLQGQRRQAVAQRLANCLVGLTHCRVAGRELQAQDDEDRQTDANTDLAGDEGVREWRLQLRGDPAPRRRPALRNA